MSYMSELYIELQEAGWKAEEIKQIPDNLAWKMASSDRKKEIVKTLKENLCQKEFINIIRHFQKNTKEI